MWPFKRRDPYEQLKGLKKIKIRGMGFTIKKLNPFLDFTTETMPQIFTDFASVKKPLPENNPAVTKKYQEDMYSIIKAGVVEPPLTKDGISVEDLFRDPSIGIRLYQEILNHSLNQFRGLKKLFFSIRIKLIYLTWCAKGMANALAVSSSKKEHLV